MEHAPGHRVESLVELPARARARHSAVAGGQRDTGGRDRPLLDRRRRAIWKNDQPQRFSTVVLVHGGECVPHPLRSSLDGSTTNSLASTATSSRHGFTSARRSSRRLGLFAGMADQSGATRRIDISTVPFRQYTDVWLADLIWAALPTSPTTPGSSVATSTCQRPSTHGQEAQRPPILRLGDRALGSLLSIPSGCSLQSSSPCAAVWSSRRAPRYWLQPGVELDCRRPVGVGELRRRVTGGRYGGQHLAGRQPTGRFVAFMNDGTELDSAEWCWVGCVRA